VEDRDTAIDNMCKKFGEEQMCSFKDMIAGKQTRSSQYSALPIGGGVIMKVTLRPAKKRGISKRLATKRQIRKVCIIFSVVMQINMIIMFVDEVMHKRCRLGWVKISLLLSIHTVQCSRQTET